MTNTVISNHEDLLMQIEYLKAEKLKKESGLKVSFNEFMESVHPVNIVKKTLSDLVNDNEIKNKVVRAGLTIGTNYIINYIMLKQKMLKQFFSPLADINKPASVSGNIAMGIVFKIGKLMKLNGDLPE
jgi:hypothetical protein